MIPHKQLFMYLIIAVLLGIVSFQQYLLEVRSEMAWQCHAAASQTMDRAEDCMMELTRCTRTMSGAVPALRIWQEYMHEGRPTPFDTININAIGGAHE